MKNRSSSVKKYLRWIVLALSLVGCANSGNGNNSDFETINPDSSEPSTDSLEQSTESTDSADTNTGNTADSDTADSDNDADGCVNIPGRLEAEDYILFSESDTINEGTGCDHEDGVDLEITQDVAGGNCNVGWTVVDEWLEYCIDAGNGGNFNISTRIASDVASRTIRIEIDGTDVTGSIVSPANGWQVYSDVDAGIVDIGTGTHTMRVVQETGDVNLNWFDFGAADGDTDSDTDADSDSDTDADTDSDSDIVGPCDIYEAAGNSCAAAYSMIRRIKGNYTGPLYQIRRDSNSENTGSGGTLINVGQTADGFGDKAAHDAACAGTYCTVAKLYDQSGNGNDIIVGTGGNSAGGTYAALDDFETNADAGPLTVAGHNVYSLYMDARQGYRSPVGSGAQPGMPVGSQSQGIYMLADGTHYGGACCWDFGNVTSTPADGWHFMDTLFFGVAYWGRGDGNGPWFMNDFEAGVWAGGSFPGEPGWGGLDDAKDAPPNTNNPSLRVKYAIGFTKASTNSYALRMADIQNANSLTNAYEGLLPQGKVLDHQGAVVLGVGGDNSNNSWGTFFEGAIVNGYPAAETEDAVFQNVKAAGYGQM